MEENAQAEDSNSMQPDRELPKRFWDTVAAMPESAQGVRKVVVSLEDGSRVYDVVVAGGREIVRVGSERDIPFLCSAIVRVEGQS